MSDLKYREDHARLRRGYLENKNARVNRLHIISTNSVQSRHYDPFFIQRFGPDANFLATGRPTDLEHKVNV